MNKLVELYRYFDKHRIYLPPDVCASLEKLVREVRSQVINFGVWVGYDDAELRESSYKQNTTHGTRAGTPLRTKYPRRGRVSSRSSVYYSVP